MFCYQCEQTAKGTGCTKAGVCGKDENIASLQDTLIFGLKGIAAYAYHARALGERDEEVDAFMHEALFKTLTNTDFDMADHVDLVMRAGRMNLKTMEMLDRANTNTFGTPVPTEVYNGTVSGPGILVTGHDLGDLLALLKQTEGTGVNIYTHGEMLPAHGYPELKKYTHLKGNFGSAWQLQRKEFPEFGGAVLVTTNCVLKPTEAYRDRIFTTGIARVEGVKHLPDHNDYSELIARAKELGDLQVREGPKLMTGFHHKPVLDLAEKIIGAVKEGKIRHFFVVGGCDGAKPGRNYYTEFAEMVPKDCVILTLGCAKYRFNNIDFGDIDGIPRLLDMGQCNNAYSAIQVAVALAEAFDTDVNSLPLSLNISWFEQKAVGVLLTLLDLGIKDIRLGPSMPAFLTPDVIALLQEKYNIQPITTPEEDLQGFFLN